VQRAAPIMKTKLQAIPFVICTRPDFAENAQTAPTPSLPMVVRNRLFVTCSTDDVVNRSPN